MLGHPLVLQAALPFLALFAPAHADVGFPRGKPVVINLGPLMSSDLDMLQDLLSGEAQPPETNPMVAESIEFPEQEIFRGLFKDFGEHLMPAMQSGSGGFQTSVEGGHFRLRASLPGYSMHRSGNGDEPLNVKVVGRTLVVQGSKAAGQMMTSFQRSFPLPFAPDANRVSVNYSAQDGSLLVDIPQQAGAEASKGGKGGIPEEAGLEAWEDQRADLADVNDLFNILAGPQMTVAFTDAGKRKDFHELRGRPRLRGLPILMGGFGSGNMPGRIPMDPFGELWEEPEVVQRDAAVEHTGSEKGEETASTSPLPLVARPKDVKVPSATAPVVVQPKEAKPFWRLSTPDTSRSEFLDIVSPQGLELGQIRGKVVEFFSKSDSSHSAYKLELPVPVNQEDCAQTQMGSHERVIRCHIQPQSVKSLHINVIDEL